MFEAVKWKTLDDQVALEKMEELPWEICRHREWKKDCEVQSFFNEEMYLTKYWIKIMLILFLQYGVLFNIMSEKTKKYGIMSERECKIKIKNFKMICMITKNL